MKALVLFSRRSVFLFALLIFFLSIAVSFFAYRPSAQGQIWKGYFTLLVEDSLPEEEAAGYLEEKNWDFLCYSREMVEIFDYAGEKTLSLAQLEAYQDPPDPRIDPYIQGLSSYYKLQNAQGSWNVFYIRGEQSPGAIKKELELLFGDKDFRWLLADGYGEAAGFSRIAAAICLGFLALLLCLCLPGKNKILAFSLLVWIGTVPGGEKALIFAAAALNVAFCFLLDKGLDLWKQHLNYPLFRKEVVKKLLPFLSFGILSLVAAFSAVAGLGGSLQRARGIGLFFLAGLAGQAAFACLTFWGETWKSSRLEHRLFYPQQILTRPVLGKKEKKKLSLSFLPACFFLVLIALPQNNEEIQTAAVPSPGVFGGLDGENAASFYSLGPSPEEVDLKDPQAWAFLASKTPEESPAFPDFSDYLAHRAYQETFAFGRAYSLPKPGETLSREAFSFSPDHGMLPAERKMIVLKEFTEEWYLYIINTVKERTISELLLAQGHPVTVGLSDTVTVAEDGQWRRAGSLFLIFYAGFVLIIFFVKGRKVLPALRKEPKTILDINVLEKEYIA